MRVSANRSAGAGGDEHTFAHSDRFHVAWLFRATLGPSRTYAARHKAGVDKAPSVSTVPKFRACLFRCDAAGVHCRSNLTHCLALTCLARV
jgi:hypothetical protein